ncbi:protein stu1 [Grosmannia clavigera kw1407]|uniref:Protein stu1 n=1 Tax=Grosmannia clavigera (strain kw1407 / UAMH 11150) TaxID=655863 RepID=F0XUI1_GROCL|nr:protein stu1 [Grosmannia clavigera kw1407]EFW98616.1 protein stu1 [Grosmannia clavigera kw1407]
MADKITLEQADQLQAILVADVSVDVKVQHVTAAKSSIKQHNVPDNVVGPLFEALRTASTSQHAALVNAGFTSVNHLLTRLSRQEPKLLIKEAARTLPLIIEKLGDLKEKYRSLAMQALTTLQHVAPLDVERFVRNTAMVGKNPRAKEASMQWLLQMHHDHGMPFRAYVPGLMELLEDADGMVRDAAKATVLDLFRSAPNAAKADLKKQLKIFKVRPAIEQAIVRELVPTSVSAAAAVDDVRPESLQPARPPLRSAVSVSNLSNFSASVSSTSGPPQSHDRPVTPSPETAGRAEPVEPSYVNTQRELDDMLRDMHAWFDGKETEQNWLKREESMTRLRRLIAGNATDFQEAFLTGVRSLLDGILKGVSSLRTSLSKEGCSLVQDLANIFGPGIDPMVELLLQTLIKLSAGTKKISSQQANATVDAIIAKVTYTNRIMQHVWAACQDKNVQPRTYAAGWVRTILNREARHKERFEHSGGLDLLEKCIKKGLIDPNPGVRERMRATFWAFSQFWPAKAEAIMSTLDATAQKLLQNDPNNPNSPKKGGSTATPVARTGLGLSKSTMGSAKPSLRETMLAKKKEALATRNLPTRPGSAMAQFSPVRTGSGSGSSSSAAAGAGSTSSLGRQRAEGGGGLSNAPVRPAKRRPELHARPATAGPYSVRTHEVTIEQSSPPERLRSRNAVTPKPLASSPKRTTGARPRMGHQATVSESNLVSPSRAAAAALSRATAANTANASAAARPQSSHMSVTPRSSPARPKSMVAVVLPGAGSSPIRFRGGGGAGTAAHSVGDENMVFAKVMDREASPPPLKVYEDPFSPDDQDMSKKALPLFSTTALEDKPINEDAANLVRLTDDNGTSSVTSMTAAVAAMGITHPNTGAGAATEDMRQGEQISISPEKLRQNTRLLDSGIARVKAQSLDVHGFRRLQGIIRDAGSIGGGSASSSGKTAAVLTDARFDSLLLGLFAYLEAPPTAATTAAGAMSGGTDKAQDVKAQILATIKLLLKKGRASFQPHVSRGLEALLASRTAYDARTHIVAGLELLADELVTLGDPSEIVLVLARGLSREDNGGTGLATSSHSLSMGLHVLKVLVDVRPAFRPTDAELGLLLTGLAQRCLESSESGVRMDAVQLCVAVHERVGDTRFWAALPGVKDDPRSLITYYIVKRQREVKG